MGHAEAFSFRPSSTLYSTDRFHPSQGHISAYSRSGATPRERRVDPRNQRTKAPKHQSTSCGVAPCPAG
jgi:hypothetical protein